MLKTLSESGGAIARLNSHLRLPLFRNAYALMFSTVATSGLGLLYWILAARYYPPDSVGLNAAVVSMLTFLAGVAQLPFMNVMLRFIPVAGRSTRRLVGRAYVISTLGATVIGAFFLLTVSWWSPALEFLRRDTWLGLWFLVGVVGWCVFALQDNVLTGLRKAIYVPLENVPYALAKIGLLMWLARVFPVYGILASWTMPLLLALAPVNYLIFRRLIPGHMAAANGQRLGYSLRQIAYYMGGNSLGALFLLAATRLLPILVTNQAGALATAYFYLPWTIATSLRLIVANMTTSFTVEVAADMTKLRGYSYRFLMHTTVVLIAPVLVLAAGAPYILRVLGGDYAAEGTDLLRLLSLAVIPNIVISLYLGVARVQQRVSGIILVQGALCLLTLGLSYWFLTLYGITGVGAAVLASETLLAMALLATSLRPLLWGPLLVRVNRLFGLREGM
jgi:O-antigen/teichoic acid export membrane protein